MIRNVGATEHEGGKKKLINLISLFQQIAEPKLFFFSYFRLELVLFLVYSNTAIEISLIFSDSICLISCCETGSQGPYLTHVNFRN